jgi:SinI restriction endonuclease
MSPYYFLKYSKPGIIREVGTSKGSKESALLAKAKLAIQSVDPNLEAQFLAVIIFLNENQEYVGKFKGKNPPVFGSTEYLKKAAEKFCKSRVIGKPVNSGKTTDPLLQEIYKFMTACSDTELAEAIEIHALFMLLENKVGVILEHYLASRLEPLGWVWCSGDFVSKVDFIKLEEDGSYSLLQIKNKDNTENSSSSKGRGNVPKWKRLKGKKAKPNWDHFPNADAKNQIDEQSFIEYGKGIAGAWLE